MIVLVAGIILNACIIGSVASLLAATDSESAQLKRKRDNMLRFMRENKVPAELSGRILQYYAYRWDSSSSFNGLWDDLSVSLRTSLNAAVMKRCLDKCPLFEDLSSAFIVSLSNVLADQLIVLIPGEIIFKEGDGGNAMYFVNRGEVTIYKMNHQKRTHINIVGVGPGGFFGEVAIVNEVSRCASRWVRSEGVGRRTACLRLGLDSDRTRLHDDIFCDVYQSRACYTHTHPHTHTHTHTHTHHHPHGMTLQPIALRRYDQPVPRRLRSPSCTSWTATRSTVY
jgi:hypothetical protein